MDSLPDKPTAPATELLLATGIDFPVLVEYAALCIEGRVRFSKEPTKPVAIIEGRERQYDVRFNSNDAIEFSALEPLPKIFEDRELVDLQCLMIGLTRLDATAEVHNRVAQRFFNGVVRRVQLSDTAQLHQECHLTLNDLGEIADWVARLQKDESETTADPSFPSVFPFNNQDTLRHKSGNEIQLYRDQNRYIETHRVDAPNPADELYSAWLASKKLKPPTRRGDPSLRWKRWRLANLLGGIPENRKREVFNWVSDIMWQVEEFHSTHGRSPISKPLEYYFDDCVIFANDQLEFELLK